MGGLRQFSMWEWGFLYRCQRRYLCVYVQRWILRRHLSIQYVTCRWIPSSPMWNIFRPFLWFTKTVISAPEEACSSSPCDNSSTCVNVNVDTFVWMCRDGYYGSTCQRSMYYSHAIHPLNEIWTGSRKLFKTRITQLQNNSVQSSALENLVQITDCPKLTGVWRVNSGSYKLKFLDLPTWKIF